MVFAMFAGGCGGSSGGGNVNTNANRNSEGEGSQPVVGTTVKLEFDGNNNGTPDIFECDGMQIIDGQSGGDFSATVPFMFNGVDAKISNIDMELEANVEYTIEFSHVLGQSLGASLPEFSLYAPDDRKVNFDFGLNSERDEPQGISENAENNDLSVKAKLTILPEEDPSVILVTFTAPVAGIYKIVANQNDSENPEIEIPWILRVYKEMRGDDGSCGYPLRFTLGETNFTVSQQDIIDLRRVIMHYATNFDDNGFPAEVNDKFFEDDIFEKLIDYIISKYEIDDENLENENLEISVADQDSNPSGASIESQVENVPYDEEFRLTYDSKKRIYTSNGVGFYAHTGMPGQSRAAALDTFTIPSPRSAKALPVKKEFYSYTINTLNELIRDLNLGAMSTFSLGMNALGKRPITTTNVRLGQISKTLLFRYEAIENSPRLAKFDLVNFSDRAKRYLKIGSDRFREEFGDYFIYGYTWGARYDAVISVTAQRYELLNDFCDKMIATANLAVDGEDYSNNLQELEKIRLNNKISVMGEFVVSGGGKSVSPLAASGTIENLMAGLVDFKKNVDGKYASRANFVPLMVSLKRFRDVPGGDVLSKKLPISEKHFDAIQDFTRSIILLRCYYNTMAAVPVDTLIDGQEKINEWKDEFEACIGSINLAVNDICESEDLLDKTALRVNTLMTKFKDLTERYVFYRKLVTLQESNQQSRGFSGSVESEDSVASGGFPDYYASTVVCGDYYKGGAEKWKSISYTGGAMLFDWHTWQPSESNTNYGDWRNVWVEAKSHKTNQSSGTDQQYPTIGRKGFAWKFEGAGTRRAEWYLNVQIAHMPNDKYPFVGLE